MHRRARHLGGNIGIMEKESGHYRVNGKQKHKRFRPKDLSEKEVENAWKQAVAWRKQQIGEKKPRALISGCRLPIKILQESEPNHRHCFYSLISEG